MAHHYFTDYAQWKSHEDERKAKRLGYLWKMPEPKPATRFIKHPDNYGNERHDIGGVDALNFEFFIDFDAEMATVPERFRYSIQKKIESDAKKGGSFIWAAFNYFHEEYQALLLIPEDDMRMIDFTDADINDEAKRLAAVVRGKCEWLCGLGAMPKSLKERIDLLKKSDERHWRRLLRKKVGRLMVHVSNLLGLVGGNGPHQITTPAVKRLFLDKQARAERFKNETMLIADDGEQIRLADIAQTYEQRLAESLCIIDGLEKKADADGSTWSFITITLPACFHPNPLRGRRSWNLVSVADSAKYLTDGWKRVRAMLAKSKTDVCGVRVAEAHADGCFHSHILMFHANDDYDRIEEAVKFQFDESEIQAKIEKSNGRACASSYAFKYLQKSNPVHDPKGQASTITSSYDEKDKVLANQALRSACGVRSMAWFGLPKGTLTKWRLVGRCRSKNPALSSLIDAVNDRKFFEFMKAATKATFIKKAIVNTYGESADRICGLWFNGYAWLKKSFRLERIKAEVALNQNHPRLRPERPEMSSISVVVNGFLSIPPPISPSLTCP